MRWKNCFEDFRVEFRTDDLRTKKWPKRGYLKQIPAPSEGSVEYVGRYLYSATSIISELSGTSPRYFPTRPFRLRLWQSDYHLTPPRRPDQEQMRLNELSCAYHAWSPRFVNCTTTRFSKTRESLWEHQRNDEADMTMAMGRQTQGMRRFCCESWL